MQYVFYAFIVFLPVYFPKWLELPTLNDVNDLIETGFVQSSLRHTISLHPMIQEIAVSETTFCYKLPHVIGFSSYLGT